MVKFRRGDTPKNTFEKTMFVFIVLFNLFGILLLFDVYAFTEAILLTDCLVLFVVKMEKVLTTYILTRYGFKDVKRPE